MTIEQYDVIVIVSKLAALTNKKTIHWKIEPPDYDLVPNNTSVSSMFYFSEIFGTKLRFFASQNPMSEDLEEYHLEIVNGRGVPLWEFPGENHIFRKLYEAIYNNQVPNLEEFLKRLKSWEP